MRDAGCWGRGWKPDAFSLLPASCIPHPLLLLDDREDVALAHEQIFFVADFDGFGGVAGEEDAVAFLDLHFAAGAVVENFAGADGDDRAAGGLVFGGVWNVNAAGGLLLRFFAFNDDFIAERLERDFGLGLGLGFRGGCGHVFFLLQNDFLWIDLLDGIS